MEAILLIRLRLIGDVVFTTPAIRAVRRRFPGARLTYLVEPQAEPVVAGNPHLDEVLIAPEGRGLARAAADWRLARLLRSRRFDLVIDFHGGPRSSWLTWATGAPTRIGYAIAGRGWHYTVRVDRPRELRRRHSVVNQWDLLTPLGIPAPSPRTDPTDMPVDREADAAWSARLAGAGTTGDARPIVVHVSAGNPFRRWPQDSFVTLVEALARDGRHPILITSGPSDASAREAVIDGVRSRLGSGAAGSILTCGELNLSELHAAISRAALFVGGDSGPLHLAATTRTPIVGLYGPTLAERSAPWRDPAVPTESVDAGELPCRPCDQRRCVPGDFRCLTAIAPSAVIAAAHRVLAAAERPDAVRASSR